MPLPDNQPKPKFDPDPEDRPERWGRLVGRTLGYAFAGLLLLNLFTRWLF